MIHELSKDRFHLVADLFKDIDHNRGVITAVLNGPFRARVFVDDPENPHSAVVYPEGFFYFVASPQPNDGFLQDFGRMLFEDWKVEIVELFFFPESLSDKLELIIGKRPYLRFERRDYILEHAAFLSRQDELLGQVPQGMELRPLDAGILAQHQVDLALWQTQQDFLKQAFGYCLLAEDRIVSQCLVGLRTEHEVELNVRTDEMYRGQGLATVVSAATVQHALRLGLEPTWSCFTFNEGSWKIAEKLGFQVRNKKSITLWDIYVEKQH